MFPPFSLADSNLWLTAGWTMIHFLWLGTLVAVAAVLCRLALRRAPANVRYACLVAWLVVLVALPVGIMGWLLTDSATVNEGAGGGAVATESATNDIAPAAIIELSTSYTDELPAAPGSAGGSLNDTNEAAVAQALPSPDYVLQSRGPTEPDYPRQSRGLPPSSSLSTLTAFIPYLPWLWLVGTPITFLMLVTGVIGARRLSRASRPIGDGPIAEILGRLAASLHITRNVTVAICERIAAPVLIGIVRPMILLPPAALTGWSPEEIEMVLLHELAHVRRWDNLINLAQRCIESLLFFHPAVWLISSWVRREREACCDALVVARTDRPHAYAEMLVALAAQMPRSVLFHPVASSAMAAGPLRSRIRRILQLEEDPMLVSGKSLTIVLGTLVAATTLALIYLPTIGSAADKSSPAPTDAPASDDKTEPVATWTSDPPTLNRYGNAPGIELHDTADTNTETQPPAIGAGTPIPSQTFFKFVLKSINGGDPVVFVNDKPLTRDELKALLPQDKPHLDQTVVSLAADKSLSYKHVKSVLTELEALGVGQVALTSSDAVVADTLRPGQQGPQSTGTAQVLGTFTGESPSELVQAIAAAMKKNLFVDFVQQEGGLALVVVPRPSEKDWPALIGVPPLKERIIAEQAWQRLGLKLRPANQAEQYIDQMVNGRSGLKIVAGKLPAGIPESSSLFKVGDTTINSFDDLLNWLENNPNDTSPVRCHAIAEGKEYLFEAGPPAPVSPNLKNPAGLPVPAMLNAPMVVSAPNGAAVIEQAWRQLGIRISLASPAEQTSRFGRALKVDSGIAIPSGHEGPVFLLGINETATNDFDDLASALNKARGYRIIVKCVVNDPKGRVFFDTALDGSDKPAQTVSESPIEQPRGKFPSLEDQKLADLALKCLGLELEPLGAEDLKRVRALGYDGGVKFVAVPNGGVGFGGTVSGTMAVDDIIVGLHVWPTTNMKDVATILERDDLAELNPLKFYVIRAEQVNDAGETRDAVRTGRLSVQNSGIRLRSSTPPPAAYPNQVSAPPSITPPTAMAPTLPSYPSSTLGPYALTPPPTLPPASPIAPTLPPSTAAPTTLTLPAPPTVPLVPTFPPPTEPATSQPVLVPNAQPQATPTSPPHAASPWDTNRNRSTNPSRNRTHGEGSSASIPTLPRPAVDPERAPFYELGNFNFQSREDRDIARRAYELLGLKFVPLDEDDLQRVKKAQHRGGLKLIDFDKMPQQEGPWLVTQMQTDAFTTGITEFKHLGQMLDAVEKLSSDDVILINGIAKTGAFTYSLRKRPAGAKSPPERIVAAYQIPSDLETEAKDLIERRRGKAFWADRKLIVQAVKTTHDEFAAILKATPEWRDPAAAAKRAAQPVVLETAEGVPTVRWQSAGLVLIPETHSEHPGMMILKVEPGSPAAWLDFRQGDIVNSLKGFDTTTIAETQSVLNTLLTGFEGKNIKVSVNVTRLYPDEMLAGRRQSNYVKELWLRPDDEKLSDSNPAAHSTGPWQSTSNTKPAAPSTFANLTPPPAAASAATPALSPVPLPPPPKDVPPAPGERSLLSPRSAPNTKPATQPSTPRTLHSAPSNSTKPTAGSASDWPADEGWSKSWTTQPAAATDSKSTPVARAATAFLQAVLKGDTERASSALTPKALKRITASGRVFSPPGLKSATFKLGTIREVDGEAKVVFLLTDNSEDPPRTEDTCCFLRKIGTDWRVWAIGYETQPNRWTQTDFETGENTAITRDLDDASPAAQASAGTPAGAGSSTKPATITPPHNPVSQAEIEVLRERVKVVSDQFKRTEALWKDGLRGGGNDRYYPIGYELALAEGELAEVEGNRDDAIEKFRLARTRAEEAVKATQASYSANNTTYDVLLTTMRNLADIKLKLIRMQANTNAEPAAAAPPETQPLAAAPPASEAVLNAVSLAAYEKSKLHYDGKTFGQWRQAWQTELSTEKRIDAVKALGAFARSGYSKEATEAILDVAGEYDFHILEGDSSPDGKLKKVILEELTPEYREQTLATHWIVGVTERLGKDPKKWHWLTVFLFSGLNTHDEDTLSILRSFAATDKSGLRLESLTALIRSARTSDPFSKSELDAPTRKLIDDALKSKNKDLINGLLPQLIVYRFSSPVVAGQNAKPKLFHQPANLLDLLFYADSDIRLSARKLLPLLDDNDAHALANELVLVTKDDARKDDRVEAIRAIGAMGIKAKDSISDLVNILMTSDDLPTRDAAMVALVRCTGRPFSIETLNESLEERTSEKEHKQILDELNAPREALGSGERRIKRLTTEDKAVLPPASSGGGMMGGGGGGFF